MMQRWYSYLTGAFSAIWAMLVVTSASVLLIPAAAIVMLALLSFIGESIYKAGIRKGSVK